MTEKRIAAFFDIDGTLVREALLIHHFKKLIRYGLIDESEWINRIRPRYRRYNTREGEYDEYLDEVAAVYKEYLRGVDRSVVDFTAQQVVEEYGNVVYRFTKDRIRRHRESGHLLFFVSGSPDFIIDKMAAKYEVTEFRATTYCLDDNDKFTSEVIPMWDSRSKARVLEELIEKYDIDPKRSYAYGDTNGDFSMMKICGHATAFNPSYRMLAMIQADEELANRVSVVVERKDVIYRLDADVAARSALQNPEIPPDFETREDNES